MKDQEVEDLKEHLTTKVLTDIDKFGLYRQDRVCTGNIQITKGYVHYEVNNSSMTMKTFSEIIMDIEKMMMESKKCYTTRYQDGEWRLTLFNTIKKVQTWGVVISDKSKLVGLVQLLKLAQNKKMIKGRR